MPGIAERASLATTKRDVPTRSSKGNLSRLLGCGVGGVSQTPEWRPRQPGPAGGSVGPMCTSAQRMGRRHNSGHESVGGGRKGSGMSRTQESHEQGRARESSGFHPGEPHCQRCHVESHSTGLLGAFLSTQWLFWMPPPPPHPGLLFMVDSPRQQTKGCGRS